MMRRYRPIRPYQFARDAEGEREKGKQGQPVEGGEEQKPKTRRRPTAKKANPYEAFVSLVVWRFATSSPLFDMILNIKEQSEAKPDQLKLIWNIEKQIRNYSDQLLKVATKKVFKDNIKEFLNELVNKADIVSKECSKRNKDRTENVDHLSKDLNDAIRRVCYCCHELVKGLMHYVWMGRVPKSFDTFQRYCKLQQYDEEVIKIATWYYSIVDSEAQVTELCNLHPKGIVGKVGRATRKLAKKDDHEWENHVFSRRVKKLPRNFTYKHLTNHTKHEHTTHKLYQRPRRHKAR